MYKENYMSDQQDPDDDIVGDLKEYNVENVPEIFVPFDFDGLHILWLEYCLKGEKIIQNLTLSTGEVSKLVSFDKKIKFVSHCKLCRNFVIYIIDHQHVKVYDQITKKTYDLYTH